MRKTRLIAVAALAIAAAVWCSLPRRSVFATSAAVSSAVQSMPSGEAVTVFSVGHEYRQDDWPSIAAAPDGSLWVAWLSFVGDRDDVALRRWRNGKWSNLLWVPGTSGDNWMPQVFADAASRVWAVWAQQVDGNWDLYARRFDPANQEWSNTERLTSDALPDIHPSVWSDGQGRAAIVWQGFRRRADGAGAASNIFLRLFDGQKWRPQVRVTDHAANDWEPSVAADSRGTIYVAYDSYRNGNYDVFMARLRDGALEAAEMPVAVSARHEVHASVAVDSLDRAWVAWEVGPVNWGKDQGYIVRSSREGSSLGGAREIRVRCFQNGAWREPAAPLGGVIEAGDPQQPRLIPDARGSVWLTANVRIPPAYQPPKRMPDGYQFQVRRGVWEYWLTHLDGDHWAKATPLPSSKGRMSTRLQGTVGPGGNLWLAWPLDGRGDFKELNKPHRQEIRAGTITAARAAASIEFR